MPHLAVYVDGMTIGNDMLSDDDLAAEVLTEVFTDDNAKVALIAESMVNDCSASEDTVENMQKLVDALKAELAK